MEKKEYVEPKSEVIEFEPLEVCSMITNSLEVTDEKADPEYGQLSNHQDLDWED